MEHREVGGDTRCGGIIARRWLPGQAPEVIDLADAALAAGVMHFDVEYGADPDAVLDALEPICGPDLTRDMIVDLLDPDELPKVKEQDDDGRVRAVSAFAVEAIEPSKGSGQRTGRLAFELVEFLANHDWLVTCCHATKSIAGEGDEYDHAPAASCTRLLRPIERRWCDGDFRTAGDLGVLFLHQLAASYAGTRRKLLSWLERWELDLYRDSETERQTLVEMRGLISELRGRLNALNVPSDEARTAWFSGVTDDKAARSVDTQIDRTLSSLDRLGDMLRSALDLLQAHATARHLQLAQQQQKAAENLQRRLETVGAVFLVPTLIAGAWGENTWVPGQNEPWGFALTIVTMVLGALVALRLLRGRQRGEATGS